MTDSINELNSDLFGSEQDSRGSDPRAARKKAMDFLARREYGHEELVGRLLAAGFERATAADAVEVLAADGLQDDQRFAEHFAAARAGRGSGPLRIRQALLERGLREALVDKVIARLDVDWDERAREVRLKKYGPDRPADFKEKARQMRFLQYRGFDHEQIQAAFR